MSFCLHVVSLTIPYPPNYGGAIDIYYKLKALSENNVDVILHCFQYDREPSDHLEELCKQVIYYKRSTSAFRLFSSKPYIVTSRNNKFLYQNLNKDNHPILAEGLHCSEILNHVNPKRVFIRTHNIEHHYYNELSNATNNIFKKVFFKTESIKLRKFESILQKAAGIFSISKLELSHFSKINPQSFLLPPFHKNEECDSKIGKGDYILIHGNLSVEENVKSVLYFIKKIIPHINFKVVIAGMNPHTSISESLKSLTNSSLITNPSGQKMNELISNAQMILLHTHQATGIKLKLINSLYEGRHCICNNTILEGTQLQDICHIANNPKEWISKINELMLISFSSEEKAYREKILNQFFNNHNNIQTFIDQTYKNVNMNESPF